MPARLRSSSRSRKPAADVQVSPKKLLKQDDSNSVEEHKNPSWGRSSGVSWLTSTYVTILLLFCPVLTIYFWMACDSFQCSLIAPVQMAQKSGVMALIKYLPQPTVQGFSILGAWILLQGLLYAFLPAKIGYGQQTPAGNLLPYKVNGLLAWVLTHVAFIAAAYFGIIKASIVHDNWGALLVAANVYGYALSLFCFIKAYFFPTHPADRKFSGSMVYDFFMGIEFNPRFGKYWDFKLFHNGRPGILAWTLINLSFAAAQYDKIGYVTNSMMLVNWLHFCYVLDFFVNEDWYLRTIDIAHDHFGFYLAWGDSVWLPWMYTLQSHYLVRNPVDLSPWAAAAVFGLGMLGYYVFRAVNDQKNLVRRTDGKCEIWGKPAKVVRAKYTTGDGKTHTSILLASGWWGVARHANYTGDLILSFAMCASCGFGHLLPFFYIIYMCILLGQRIQRDDDRCTQKYGKYWAEYKELVPYCLIPYIY